MTLRETSALFSLQELMKLEEERVREENAREQRRIFAEEAARLAAEQLVREQKEAEARKAEELRTRESARLREEAARLEAIRQGELERVREEARNRARVEDEAKAREHELRLSAIRQGDERRKLVRTLRFTVGLSLVALGSLVYVYLGRVAPEARRRAQGLEAEVMAERAKAAENLEALRARQDKVHELEERIAHAEGRSPSAPAQASSPSPAIRPGSVRGGSRPTLPPPKVGTPSRSCTCDEHDPLCGCFKSHE